MKNRGIFIAVIILIIFFLVMLLTPSPKDKRFTYSKEYQTPHGCSILFEELNHIFPNADIEVSDTTFYKALSDYEGENAAYIVIGDNMSYNFNYQNRSRDSTLLVLDEFVEQGNQVFLSVEYLSLVKGVKSKYLSYYDYSVGGTNSKVDSITLTLNKRDSLIPKLSYRPFGQDPNYVERYLDIDGSYEQFKLGYAYPEYVFDERKDTFLNFVRVPHGKGNYFFFANPQLFTNYMLIDEEKAEYSSAVLSHLGDVDHVIWDEHYKPYNSFLGGTYSGERKTPLYLFSSNPALKVAKFLFLLGALVLIVTRFRRKQRPIPIIKPPNNKTVEFTKNMSQLYHERGEHYNLGKKMMAYFEFDFRRKYKTKDFDHYTKNIKLLAKLTQLNEEDLTSYYQKRSLMKKVTELSEYQLIIINKIIEKLK